MIWDRCFHPDRCSPFRQFKFDFPSMQAKVFYLRECTIARLKGVLVVSHYSIPRILAVHANLMVRPV